MHYALLIGEGEARHRGDDRQAFTLNIGLGGAFVETADPEAPGSLLAVDLVVPPDGRVITIHADVRWATDATDGEPHGMGIRFHGLDEEQSAVLGEYFASLVPTVDHDEAP